MPAGKDIEEERVNGMKTTLHSAGPAPLTSGRPGTSIHTLSEVAHQTISALRCTASGRGTEKGGLNSGL